MNLFQIITLPLIGLLFLRSLFALVRGSHPRGMAILGVLIWLMAGIAILFPDLTIRIAKLLGIGRGADLVLYILVISFLISMFFIYNRFRKLESEITEIVRSLAIRDAHTGDRTGVPGSYPADQPTHEPTAEPQKQT